MKEVGIFEMETYISDTNLFMLMDKKAYYEEHFSDRQFAQDGLIQN